MREWLRNVRWAGGFRRWARWRLWERDLVRCPYCTGMPKDEWEAMCDCFIPHKGWIR